MTDVPVKPGDNPNLLNAKPRQNVRPRVQNSSGSKTNQSMRMGWVDPLPKVDAIYPLGLEPNVESIPAGEVELDVHLPENIAKPFADTATALGDRIQITDEEKDEISESIYALGYFKAARQLYSTMLDHEKSSNQPLKAVYYDETPVPVHMGGALGIIGHMETKVGKVVVRDAPLLFKRWIAMGLKWASESGDSIPRLNGSPSKFVWNDKSSFHSVQRAARDKIASLVKQTYTVDSNGHTYTVSMPQLDGIELETYYGMINARVPNADELKALVAGLISDYDQFRDDNLPHDQTKHDLLDALGWIEAPDSYSISSMRDDFEAWIAEYTTRWKWRVESMYNVGPPPAGTNGYGAQTVSVTGNVARWQFPLSDADINIGYLFSPSKGFTLTPKLVGYGRRSPEDASASFAHSDAKKFA